MRVSWYSLGVWCIFIVMGIERGQVLHWMSTFAAAVRQQDFQTGRNLFDDKSSGFGTVAIRVNSLDELEHHQWRRVWTTTKDFDFDYDSARIFIDDSQAAATSTWTSLGFKSSREPFLRRGRATVILILRSVGLRAIHTHFSMDPEKNLPSEARNQNSVSEG